MARIMEKLVVVKKFFTNRFTLLGIFILSCLLILGMTVLKLNTFTVKADGDVKVIKTYDSVLSNVLKENEINTNAKDEINSVKLGKNFYDVTIRRGFFVNLFVDGATMSANVYDGTVNDFLSKFDLTYNPKDEINYKLEDLLFSGMDIKINRVEYKTITEDIKIPYKTELIPLSFSYDRGYRNKGTSGVEGIKRVYKQQKIVDGIVIETTVINEEIVRQPKTAVQYSDASNLLNVGMGKPTEYKNVFSVTATAYNADEPGLGDNTATGKKCQVGYVAVDRNIIPLGTKLYIESSDGSYVYGYAEAQDTGGAIKGNRIDIYLPSVQDCYRFGRRSMKVYILE